ncbi:MAG: hypothetical protein AB2556_23260 [Candidatus Thiodiazotropha sp.]
MFPRNKAESCVALDLPPSEYLCRRYAVMTFRRTPARSSFWFRLARMASPRQT